jgi:hypothetical protein
MTPEIILIIAMWCMKPTASAALTMSARADQKNCRDAMIKCLEESKPIKGDLQGCIKTINP